MFIPIGLFWKVLKRFAPDLVMRAQRLSPTEKAKFLSHFLVPGLILGITIFFGGWVTIGYERGVAISELKTEISGTGATSIKRGVVVIAEPISSKFDYLIPVTSNTSTIWSSLDGDSAGENVETYRLALNARLLHGNSPLITSVNEPVVLIVEGDLGTEIEIPGYGKESVENWRLSSRRSLSLVFGVMINCALALGIGVVTGSPSVNPNQDNARQIGAEPNEE